MYLWLDDIRPAPDGWHHVRTVDEAKAALTTGEVKRASLDHDLGACAACLGGKDPEEWLIESGGQHMPHCDHFGTGYQLVSWMEETGNWPKTRPTVHSANRVGRQQMLSVISKHYGSLVKYLGRLSLRRNNKLIAEGAR
jgi:hypothetical protein